MLKGDSSASFFIILSSHKWSPLTGVPRLRVKVGEQRVAWNEGGKNRASMVLVVTRPLMQLAPLLACSRHRASRHRACDVALRIGGSDADLMRGKVRERKKPSKLR